MPATPVHALLGSVLLLGSAWAGPALACSVSPKYRPPTTLDLAARADAIVIAEVDGERRSPTPEWGGDVLATTRMILHGAIAPRRIAIPESIITQDRTILFRSAPRELREPNEGALIGGCVRYTFARGMKLVLFLSRDQRGKWMLVRGPFARDAEDVSGLNALWVKAVREYTTIAKLPERRRSVAMRQRIRALRATGTTDEVVIAADMQAELKVRR
ncbi:hypothetical protein ACFQ15_16640 [Sphingomonas hankookensis]|uniref:hypothetical protein n=1 Tax=Sphingomonas hankookensis TaxID=563996 RepID=UPI001F56C1BE|nr:hypothetical protein [Sphingomonas hankookensis]